MTSADAGLTKAELLTKVNNFKSRLTKAEAVAEQRDQQVKNMKAELKSLQETARQNKDVLAEVPMLREALSEQQQITRKRESQMAKLADDLRTHEELVHNQQNDLASLREAAAENQKVIQKYREDEMQREIVEAEKASLKRKREEEMEVERQRSKANGLISVPYCVQDDGAARLVDGLRRLRQHSLYCDTVVVASGERRLNVHSTVFAATSVALPDRLGSPSGEHSTEIDMRSACPEAVDLVVKWLYGEIGDATYEPTTADVNKDVLSLASKLGLPQLCELCCAHFARGVTANNFVECVRLCEEHGLPRFRSALVAAVLKDVDALPKVAADPQALDHPALMRELLAAVAAWISPGQKLQPSPPRMSGQPVKGGA